MKTLGSRSARRLTMLADTGELRHIGRADELLEVISRYGDRAMDFVWRHKGALAISAVLAAFLNDPVPFINGTRDIADLVGENVARPLAEVPGKVAVEAARNTNWTVVITITAIGLGLALLIHNRYRQKAQSSCEGG